MSTQRVRRAEINAVLVRLAYGDREATTPLVTLLWPVRCAFASRAVGNADDAQDIAQETLIKIAARVSDFDVTRDGLSWAFAIALFEVKSHRKRVTRRNEVTDPAVLEQVTDGRSSSEQLLLDEDLEQALGQAIAQLDDNDRRLLGTPGVTTAGAASLPALRKRRQRAVDRLKAAWRELYG